MFASIDSEMQNYHGLVEYIQNETDRLQNKKKTANATSRNIAPRPHGGAGTIDCAGGDSAAANNQQRRNTGSKNSSKLKNRLDNIL